MKSFALVLCLFCVFSLSIAQECNINYDEYATDPVCEWVTDENGEESQECYSSAGASHAAQLSRADNSVTETRFPVSFFGWDGNCDCTVTYWQDNNGRGCHVRRSFGRDGDGGLRTSQVLKVKAGSITFTCQFEI